MGYSVSGAGDVNGDGYADVIVGAWLFDNGESNEGAAFLFLGGAGVSPPPLLGKADASPLGAPGVSTESDSIRLQLAGMAPPSGHASRIRMEYQVKSYGATWESVPVMAGDWVNPPLAGHTFDQLITGIPEANGHQIRYRIGHLSEQYFQPGITPPPNSPAGRWIYPQWATEGPSDFRTSGYRPPTDPGLSIAPTLRYTTDGIVANVVPSSSPAVPPKTIQYYEYVWSNGNQTVIHESPSESDLLDASATRKHEVWSCTVRAWDGVQYSFRDASATAPAIQNTLPAAPEVAIPAVQSTSQNLVAQLSQVAADPDLDPIQYDFDWHLKRAGDGSFTLFRNGALSPSISSQINNSDTQPGDQWYVVVTPHDGEEYGAPASTESTPTTIVLGGVEPSFIALGVSPNALTLGQSVTASGNVFP
ncbi:MAG: integrin alpha, partial [Gammaproteobacteria bacterium]|nr:integrin alpha [Gammaproteobacteria bacterium]